MVPILAHSRDIILALLQRQLLLARPLHDPHLRLAMHIHDLAIEEIDVDRIHPRADEARHRDDHCRVERVRVAFVFEMSGRMLGLAKPGNEQEEGTYVATAPVIGGNAVPPGIAATIKLPPIFVCLPKPLNLNVKIVAKQALSQHKTRQKRAIEPLPWVCEVARMKMKHMKR